MDCQQRPRNGWPAYVPTPEVIAAECARIRAGWDDHTRMVRMGLNPYSYLSVELVKVGDLEAVLEESRA
jgi:hypothetical protein